MLEPKATPGAYYRACTSRPSGATLAAFFARGVTPASLRPGYTLGAPPDTRLEAGHDGFCRVTGRTARHARCHHQYQMLLSASWWSRRRLQAHTTGLVPHDPAARPLRFFLQGARRHLLTSRVHPSHLTQVVIDRRLLRDDPHVRAVWASHKSCRVIWFFAASLLFHCFNIIIICFYVKNGSFQHIEIHTGAPLAPFPQISPKNHYKLKRLSMSKGQYMRNTKPIRFSEGYGVFY